jgi:predicted permease
MPGPAVGSVIQSNVRWNTMIGLSIGSLLFGEEGLALVTIAAAVMIPTANIISVYALIAHADQPHGPRPNPFRALLRNPIVLACIAGLALAGMNASLPRLLDDSLRILGDAALALGLLSAGAGVDLSALRRAGTRTLIWSLVRLLGLPALAVGFCVLLGVTGVPLVIALICAATPTATSSYILAKELGGDAPLAANLIAVETVLAMITLPGL